MIVDESAVDELANELDSPDAAHRPRLALSVGPLNMAWRLCGILSRIIKAPWNLPLEIPIKRIASKLQFELAKSMLFREFPDAQNLKLRNFVESVWKKTDSIFYSISFFLFSARFWVISSGIHEARCRPVGKYLKISSRTHFSTTVDVCVDLKRFTLRSLFCLIFAVSHSYSPLLYSHSYSPLCSPWWGVLTGESP